MMPSWDLGLSYRSKKYVNLSHRMCVIWFTTTYLLVTLISTFVLTFARYSFLLKEKKTTSKLVFPPTELRLACIMFQKKTGPKCRDGGRRIDNKERAATKAVQKTKTQNICKKRQAKGRQQKQERSESKSEIARRNQTANSDRRGEKTETGNTGNTRGGIEEWRGRTEIPGG